MMKSAAITVGLTLVALVIYEKLVYPAIASS